MASPHPKRKRRIGIDSESRLYGSPRYLPRFVYPFKRFSLTESGREKRSGSTDTPVCVARPRTVAVGEGETARLSCRVEAVPDDPLSFTWVFNNTLDTVHVENHRLSPVRGLSILDYTPRSTRDYGTLSCWAANSLGSQTDPCRFTIIEAGESNKSHSETLLRRSSTIFYSL
ncbi:hypothetical protein E2C01_016235 [Portunus trituberculatus]|uniref:Ig-like domain-containing protein n=1 Tax=Portunus trituberculatus TaxID=210409 RepID=A0A5B7DQI4_PORTR|nr:hypothetical protein [Portunus trituberculatus]